MNFDPLLWFVCPFCKKALPDIEKFKLHAIEVHCEEGECLEDLQIECVVFEECFLDQELPAEDIDSTPDPDSTPSSENSESVKNPVDQLDDCSNSQSLASIQVKEDNQTAPSKLKLKPFVRLTRLSSQEIASAVAAKTPNHQIKPQSLHISNQRKRKLPLKSSTTSPCSKDSADVESRLSKKQNRHQSIDEKSDSKTAEDFTDLLQFPSTTEKCDSVPTEAPKSPSASSPSRPSTVLDSDDVSESLPVPIVLNDHPPEEEEGPVLDDQTGEFIVKGNGRVLNESSELENAHSAALSAQIPDVPLLTALKTSVVEESAINIEPPVYPAILKLISISPPPVLESSCDSFPISIIAPDLGEDNFEVLLDKSDKTQNELSNNKELEPNYDLAKLKESILQDFDVNEIERDMHIREASVLKDGLKEAPVFNSEVGVTEAVSGNVSPDSEAYYSEVASSSSCTGSLDLPEPSVGVKFNPFAAPNFEKLLVHDNSNENQATKSCSIVCNKIDVENNNELFKIKETVLDLPRYIDTAESHTSSKDAGTLDEGFEESSVSEEIESLNDAPSVPNINIQDSVEQELPNITAVVESVLKPPEETKKDASVNDKILSVFVSGSATDFEESSVSEEIESINDAPSVSNNNIQDSVEQELPNITVVVESVSKPPEETKKDASVKDKILSVFVSGSATDFEESSVSEEIESLNDAPSVPNINNQDSVELELPNITVVVESVVKPMEETKKDVSTKDKILPIFDSNSATDFEGLKDTISTTESSLDVENISAEENLSVTVPQQQPVFMMDTDFIEYACEEVVETSTSCTNTVNNAGMELPAEIFSSFELPSMEDTEEKETSVKDVAASEDGPVQIDSVPMGVSPPKTVEQEPDQQPPGIESPAECSAKTEAPISEIVPTNSVVVPTPNISSSLLPSGTEEPIVTTENLVENATVKNPTSLNIKLPAEDEASSAKDLNVNVDIPPSNSLPVQSPSPSEFYKILSTNVQRKIHMPEIKDTEQKGMEAQLRTIEDLSIKDHIKSPSYLLQKKTKKNLDSGRKNKSVPIPKVRLVFDKVLENEDELVSETSVAATEKEKDSSKAKAATGQQGEEKDVEKSVEIKRQQSPEKETTKCNILKGEQKNDGPTKLDRPEDQQKDLPVPSECVPKENLQSQPDKEANLKPLAKFQVPELVQPVPVSVSKLQPFKFKLKAKPEVSLRKRLRTTSAMTEPIKKAKISRTPKSQKRLTVSENSNSKGTLSDPEDEEIRVIFVAERAAAVVHTVSESDSSDGDGNDSDYNPECGSQKKPRRNLKSKSAGLKMETKPKIKLTFNSGTVHELKRKSTTSLVKWLTLQKENSDSSRIKSKNVILLDPDPTADGSAEFKISTKNPIKCKLCSQKLVTEPQLKNHVENCWQHNKQKHLLCISCHTEFSTPVQLQRHSARGCSCSATGSEIKPKATNSSNPSLGKLQQKSAKKVETNKSESTPNLSLGEWLKQEKETNPSNVIALEPKPEPDPKTGEVIVSRSSPIKCQLCQITMTSESNVIQHVRNCWELNSSKHLYCVACDLSFAYTKGLQRHVKNKHTKSALTKKYGEQTTDDAPTPAKGRPALRPLHELDEEEDKLPLVPWILKMRERFSTEILLKPDPTAPKVTSTGSGKKPQSGTAVTVTETCPVVCRLCEERLISEAQVKAHVKVCWDLNKAHHRYCIPCQLTFAYSKGLQRHNRRKHCNSTYNRKYSQKQFRNRYRIRRLQSKNQTQKQPPLKEDEPSPKQKQPPSKEDEPKPKQKQPPLKEDDHSPKQKQPPSKEDEPKPKQKQPPRKEDPNPKQQKSSSQKVQEAEAPKSSVDCPTCGRSLSSKTQLNDHMRIHTGERPFKCTFKNCALAFPSRNSLINHQRLKKHKGELVQRQKQPQKQREPEAEKPRRPAAFDLQNELYRHLRDTAGSGAGTHPNQPDPNRSFKCVHKGCSKKFETKKELDKHGVEHKPYKCETCGLSFRAQVTFLQHKRTHQIQKEGARCPSPDICQWT